MFIHPTQNILRNEAADYPLGEHDDVLDTLALQLQLFRGQMSQERWSKYKESERKLLRVLSGRSKDTGGLVDKHGKPLGANVGVLDLDDEEEPSQRWDEVVIA